MEVSAYDLAIIAGGFSIAGALIAVIAGHWLAKNLASHTYRLQKLDENRRQIISLFSGLYPVVINWPTQIEDDLISKTPQLCELIQQCHSHMSVKDFKSLLVARDEFISDASGYIKKQSDRAEILYSNGKTKNGQKRLQERIQTILKRVK
jgi:hypothetical protein